jgi:glucokinase
MTPIRELLPAGRGAAAGRARPLVVGIDVGGSKIAVLVVDRSNNVLARHHVANGALPPDRAADAITAAARHALDDAGATHADVAAIGVGVPGRVDPARGVVEIAVNLGWLDLPLQRLLEERLEAPCRIENDVRAAALGLHERGVVQPVRDFAYVAVGTGIAAGVVLDGRLHRGVRGLAGEIGHVVVDPLGPLCACGLRGCLEAFAAGPAIARRAAQLRAGPRPVRRAAAGPARSRAPTTASVFQEAAAGEEAATTIVADVGRRIAWAVHLLVLAYDLERVVLGGGVSHAGEALLLPVREELDRLRAASPFARQLLATDVLEVMPPGSDTGAWGAVTVARDGTAGPTRT